MRVRVCVCVCVCVCVHLDRKYEMNLPSTLRSQTASETLNHRMGWWRRGRREGEHRDSEHIERRASKGVKRPQIKGCQQWTSIKVPIYRVIHLHEFNQFAVSEDYTQTLT